MDAYSQERRLLRIETVLGQDHILLVSMTGRDSISSSFSYDLQVASTDHSIQAADLLGTSVTIWSTAFDQLSEASARPAPVNGIVSRFAVIGRNHRGLCFYRLRLVASLWLLTRTSDCRIFQDQNVREIVDVILGEHNIRKRRWRLSAEPEKRDYCVQYRETAYDFICRLLEEEGIFFYFLHDEKGHTVVFSDHNHGLTKCANANVEVTPQVNGPGRIWRWESSYRIRSGQWAQSDYNFETPATTLKIMQKTVNPVLAKQSLEMFEFPGRYVKKSSGDALTKLRIEYEEATYQQITGESGCADFAAGACFTVSNADIRDADQEYLITAVEHEAEDWSLITTEEKQATYANQFRCALRSVPYRPEMKTPRPRIHSTQTAVVTGPGGSEIFTDKYGRIKVQFHWDRLGKKDDKSSCWVRVAQSWAGRTFGSWFVPRMGQEVVVAFLDGDPDRPLVVGSVYNADQMVPFALPANATQSGLRTRSSLGGSPANVNEWRFEDKKGQEQVYLHAEKNFDQEVENDETHWVGRDETRTVGHDRTEHIKHDETITVDNNRTETVHANETVTVNKNRTHTVGLNDTLTVGVARVHTVGTAEAITVGAARTVTVGATQAITVGASQTITVGSSQTITVGADQTISVAKNETTSVGDDRSMSVGKSDTLDVGKKLTITAGDEIVLKTGSATITMKKNGDITIEGKTITIKGSGDVIIKGQKILQN
jgi:type VI secretion system secreted protein VgrG